MNDSHLNSHYLLKKGAQSQKPANITQPWDPNCAPRMIWDVASMLIIMIQMLLIPLTLSFDLQVDQGTQAFFDSMDYFFMVDVFVQFNTGYFYKGQLIQKRSLITLKYLKFWFWLDSISSLPYDNFTDGQNVQMIKFLRFFKFLKVIKMLRAVKLKRLIIKIQEHLDSSFQSLLEFCKLCIIIGCLAHWSACIFNIVNENQYDYLTSFYFSITTMITIGYGDVHPETSEQYIYSVFAMILASGVFGYAMNSMITIFSYEDPEFQQLQLDTQIVNKYIKQHNCPDNLKDRIQDYLEWRIDNDSMARAQHIITDLSIELKEKVVFHLNIVKLRLLPISMNAVMDMQEHILPPETEIFDMRADNMDIYIYYIVSGKVGIFAHDTFLGEASKWCGEIAFFGNCQRMATLKAMNTTNIIKISRQTMLRMLDQEQFEKYHMIKNRVENQNLSDFQITCLGCQNVGHVIKYCPLFHYIPKQIFLPFFKRKQLQKRKRVFNQRLIEYYAIMAERRLKKDQKQQGQIRVVQNYSIDVIKEYNYFDLSWNFSNVIRICNLKCAAKYYFRYIRRNIKRIIRKKQSRLLKLQIAIQCVQ